MKWIELTITKNHKITRRKIQTEHNNNNNNKKITRNTMETSTSETDFVRDIVSTDTSGDNFEIYRSFLEYFAENVDPTDQLPVRVPNYTLEENEISGAVIDWTIQYLTDK